MLAKLKEIIDVIGLLLATHDQELTTRDDGG